MKIGIFIGLVFMVLLTNCSSIQLNPGAEQIRIVTEQPKNCTYLGDVVGSHGDFVSGVLTSNHDLEKGALNDLKNKALEMGANTLHLISNRAGQTGALGQGGGALLQTNVTYVGIAYKCP